MEPEAAPELHARTESLAVGKRMARGGEGKSSTLLDEEVEVVGVCIESRTSPGSIELPKFHQSGIQGRVQTNGDEEQIS